MLSDDNFLAQLLADAPANDTRRVYADGREERGDPAPAERRRRKREKSTKGEGT